MRLHIVARGRIGRGPEADLVDTYLGRIRWPVRVTELGTADPLPPADAGTRTVALDERGPSLPSKAFADRLAAWRDDGVREVRFLLGAADGLGDAARADADMLLSFGAATWPHLLAAEFVASLVCLAFTFVFSVFVNAPLLQLANTNQTPNPSKAPWYFLGLQELLTMFHPMIAGVTIPGVGLIVMIFAPYIDKNPSNKPEDRKFATSLMTIHLMFWAVLVIIGSFFRGPGFNFTLPWRDGIFFEL